MERLEAISYGVFIFCLFYVLDKYIDDRIKQRLKEYKRIDGNDKK